MANIYLLKMYFKEHESLCIIYIHCFVLVYIVLLDNKIFLPFCLINQTFYLYVPRMNFIFTILKRVQCHRYYILYILFSFYPTAKPKEIWAYAICMLVQYITYLLYSYIYFKMTCPNALFTRY